MKLRIGFVSIIRPLFKGDSPQAAIKSLEDLERLAKQYEFELITPTLNHEVIHVASQKPLPSFAVSDLESAEVAAKIFKDRELDYLIIQHTTFATGELLVPLLQSVARVAIWALPETAGGLGAEGPLPLNSLCGLNMTLSFLEHPRLAKKEPVKWFYGEASSDWFQARFKPSLAALRGLRAIEQARILQIGGTAPGFYGIEDLPAWGQVDTLPLAALFDSMAKLSDKEVQAVASDWAKKEGKGVAQERLVSSARIELALAALLKEGHYQALAMRCWPEVPETCQSMACASFARLGDQDLPAACEGDVLGALSMLALNAITQSPSILMDLSDIDLNDDSVQVWHCGNAPLAWAKDRQTRLSQHFNRSDLGLVRDMTLRPGPVTGLRFLTKSSKALIVRGGFLAEKPGFQGVRAWLSELKWHDTPISAQGFVANLLDYRLPHHIAFGMGDVSEALEEVCAHLNLKVLPAKPLKNSLVP